MTASALATTTHRRRGPAPAGRAVLGPAPARGELAAPACAIGVGQHHRPIGVLPRHARDAKVAHLPGAVHDPGLAKVLAPLRNAATAAGLLTVKS